jgi:hypothetical protein
MLHACLYTIFFVFYYTSWYFYAFSGTNLLIRYHSASSLFSTVFVFQKRYTGNILRIGRNKSWTSYFYQSFAKTKDETEGGQGPASPPGGAAQPLAVPACGETTWSHFWCCPFAYKVPSIEKKPRGRISFPQNILQAAAIAVTRLRESRSSSRHPTGEGNPCRRPSTPPWSPPEWCVSSLPWTMGP